ncbi:tubulin epsilon and delta complex protein 1 isoform X4 [Phycodurus eques]|uniref:tubulin epsilon and delta complex protein 1 isoform X4 n=1 Tax=Phycodurus eques TaxID=693459 RepID=UPI002ACE00B3|nr:tubulin epsilon and delta complex protein 1 isoform X4 [Phycodurus eques]
MNHVLLRGVMQRHKASVEVKQVIGTLCKLLTATGLQHVPTPETFRRAKFGEVDVEDRLWQLLANILQTTTVSSAGCTQMINVTAEHRMLVSTGLWQSGYYAGWMYGRAVGGVSSRELLLALGWVLAAGTLEKLLTQRVQQLDKTLLPPILVFSTSLPSGLSSSGQTCTALNETCIGVQELCDLLGLYLKWKQVENVFWTWMDSVVDYHVKDAVAERPTQIVTRAADACHPGQLAVGKLEDVLLRLKTVQKPEKMCGWNSIFFVCSERMGKCPPEYKSTKHLTPCSCQPRKPSDGANRKDRRLGEGTLRTENADFRIPWTLTCVILNLSLPCCLSLSHTEPDSNLRRRSTVAQLRLYMVWLRRQMSSQCLRL